MKKFIWDETKNRLLQNERGISFEEILEAIATDGLLEVLEHPNPKKYKNQKLFVVKLREYVHLVPFYETKKEIVLKTIIPSRKYDKKYRRKNL